MAEKIYIVGATDPFFFGDDEKTQLHSIWNDFDSAFRMAQWAASWSSERKFFIDIAMLDTVDLGRGHVCKVPAPDFEPKLYRGSNGKTKIFVVAQGREIISIWTNSTMALNHAVPVSEINLSITTYIVAVPLNYNDPGCRALVWDSRDLGTGKMQHLEKL